VALPPPRPLDQLKAYQVDDMFLALKGAVFCGGAAVFFDKILKLFGYDSFTLDFGDTREELTHVTTILPVKEGGGWQYYIFDPSFNAVMVSTEGKLLSVFDLIRYAQSGRSDDVHVRSKPLMERRFFLPPALEGGCQIVRRKFDDYTVCQFPKCGAPDLGCNFFDNYLERFAARFSANGYPIGKGGFLKLLTRRVYSVGPSIDPFFRQDFLARLSEVGVPVGNP
jgi:hypothetical protein